MYNNNTFASIYLCMSLLQTFFIDHGVLLLRDVTVFHIQNPSKSKNIMVQLRAAGVVLIHMPLPLPFDHVLPPSRIQVFPQLFCHRNMCAAHGQNPTSTFISAQVLLRHAAGHGTPQKWLVKKKKKTIKPKKMLKILHSEELYYVFLFTYSGAAFAGATKNRFHSEETQGLCHVPCRYQWNCQGARQ